MEKQTTAKHLSVILVTTDNHVSFLPTCLQSLESVNQSIPLKIYCVDNDGEGKSTQFLRESSFALDMTLISQRFPKGFAANVNDALARVQDPFVLILNVDTIVNTAAIAGAMDYLQSNPKVGAVSVKFESQGHREESSGRAFPTPGILFWEQIGVSRIFPTSARFGKFRNYYLTFNEPTEVDWISGAFMLIRSEALKGVGDFEEGYFLYSEDTDFCYRLKQHGWQIVFLPQFRIYHHRDPQGSHRRTLIFVLTHRSLLLFWEKNLGTATRRCGAAVLLFGLLFRWFSSPLLFKKGFSFFKQSITAYRIVSGMVLRALFSRRLDFLGKSYLRNFLEANGLVNVQLSD